MQIKELIQMGGKSINWINVVKALCIIFVFLRHAGTYYGYSTGWVGEIYIPFYVNAFFFVSGYLLFWKQLSPPKIEESRKTYLSTGGVKHWCSMCYIELLSRRYCSALLNSSRVVSCMGKA